MEDIARIAVMQEKLSTLHDGLQAHLRACETAQAETNRRLRALERLSYIALGGIIVLAGLMSFIGQRLLALLGG